MSASLQGILASDECPHRWPKAVSQAKEALSAMSSGEKIASAANNFSLAAQLQFQHQEVQTLMNRMTELLACTKSFSFESIDQVLSDGREHAIACLISSSRNSTLIRPTNGMSELPMCSRSFSLELINKVFYLYLQLALGKMAKLTGFLRPQLTNQMKILYSLIIHLNLLLQMGHR